MLAFFKKYGQTLINLVLFVGFIGLGIVQAYKKIFLTRTLDYIELGFIVQSICLAIVILFRKPFRFFNKSWYDQTIALIAFFSGAVLFRDQAMTGGPGVILTSQIIVFLANVSGLWVLFNLGRSFGILIALREVKTTGMYGIIRHPMYFTDILLRIGFVVSHFNLLSILVLLISTPCYVYRAILEERFLSQQPEYQAYKQRVKYRFIPGIF